MNINPSPHPSPRLIPRDGVAAGTSPTATTENRDGHAAPRIRPDASGHARRLPDQEAPGNGLTSPRNPLDGSHPQRAFLERSPSRPNPETARPHSALPREDRFGNPIRHRENESAMDPWAGLMETTSGERTKALVSDLHAAPGFLRQQSVTTVPLMQTAGRKIASVASTAVNSLNTQVLTHLISAMSVSAVATAPLAILPTIVHGASAYNAHSRVKSLNNIKQDVEDHKYPYEDKQGEMVTKVLPYVIQQQEKREFRKKISAIPVLGGSVGIGPRHLHAL